LKKQNLAIIKKYEELLSNMDNILVKIDKKLSLLRHIKPINLEEEKQKFIEKR
jgi:hypothetical protein